MLRPLSRVTAGRNTQAKRCPRGPRREPPFKRSWGNARVWAAPLRGPLPHPTPRRWRRACHAHPWPAPSSLTRASPIAAHDPGTPPHERRRTSPAKGLTETRTNRGRLVSFAAKLLCRCPTTAARPLAAKGRRRAPSGARHLPEGTRTWKTSRTTRGCPPARTRPYKQGTQPARGTYDAKSQGAVRARPPCGRPS